MAPKIAAIAELLLTDTALIKCVCSQLLLVHLSPQRPSYLLLSTTPCLSLCLFASIVNASLLLVNCNELQVKVRHVHSTQRKKQLSTVSIIYD